MKKQGLKRSEIIKSKLLIDALFKNKKGFIVYPIRIAWLETEKTTEERVMFSVSKRKFKHATDRNRIKRQIREAYRLNKSLFLEKFKDRKIVIFIGYVANKQLPYTVIEDKIKEGLLRLSKEINSNEN